MNTSLSVKRVLLYGDSFVYGKASGENKRLDTKTRFTGVLQDLLGNGYEIIEEGLRARTLSGENAFFQNRNGLVQFGPILGSHLPIDLLVIFLGTNDCNSSADNTPEQVADGLKKYKPILEEWCAFLEVAVPKLLIISPPEINESYYDEGSLKIFGKGAAYRVSVLSAAYETAADKLAAEFLDAAQYCQPSSGDGIHLDSKGNHSLAIALHDKILKILP